MSKNLKKLFDMSETDLHEFYLECVDAARESNPIEDRGASWAKVRMIDAIGAWRFPKTWKP